MFNALFRAPEVPPAALVRLREVDPRLSMRFVQSVAENYWVITRDWEESDPRWASVQKQEIDPKFANDIVATLPGDCSPAEAGAFVEKFFKKSDDPKKDAIKAVEQQVREDAARQEKNLTTFILEQNERALKTSDHERRLLVGGASANPMISGVGSGKRRKKE